ncbi:uncharacterized protein LOC113336291 [Papaver somniferum]|uniref:uncharacterized protein LOC113336291 n=1 Tax=Papaver somniferum TaxID=3469 RepID=UPI000E701144|nr:uncharacterized protein LOC113336291 [Papaver somniferum]
MDTSSNSVINLEENDGDQDEELTATPLWKYVQKIDKKTGDKGGGGGQKFICNFGCKVEPYAGSYSRVRQHLIGILPGGKYQGISLCSKVSKEMREILKKEELDARSLYGDSAKVKKLSLPNSSTTQNQQTCTGQSELFESIVNKMFQKHSRDDVDQKIARCLYVNAIPMNVLRSPSWAEMVSAINNAPKGYKSPSYEKARTSLLDKEQMLVKQALNPLVSDWQAHGVSIVSDGWSNVKNTSLINIMAVSDGKAMFLSAHDVSGIEKTGENISAILLKAIEEIGPWNVIQVLTDNAANCKLAGEIIEQKYPHIFWSGCLAHTLNLLMKDIAKSKEPAISFVKETYTKGKDIVKFVRNHSQCLALFKKFSHLEVLKSKKTRFGFHFVVLSRIVEVRASLISMVLSEEWKELKKPANAEEHAKITSIVMDGNFWSNAEKVLRITKPIYIMLRFSDSDKAVIGEAYEQMDTMLGNLQDTLADDIMIRDITQQIVVQRWSKTNIPLHCLAYLLVPKYYTNAWLMKPAPGGVSRKKPNFDQEVQDGYLAAIDKMFPVPEEAAVIRHQISDFVSNGGCFARPQAIADRAKMSAKQWWGLYGGGAPELYNLAMRVLSQSVNSSCAERCWSTYSYIHSVKRNKLGADRAEKLVYVHYNQRLLARQRADYGNLYRNWDVNPEENNIEEAIEVIEARERDAVFDDEANYFTTPTPALIPPSSPTPTPPPPPPPPPPSSQEQETQAQIRVQSARNKHKRQKKSMNEIYSRT